MENKETVAATLAAAIYQNLTQKKSGGSSSPVAMQPTPPNIDAEISKITEIYQNVLSKLNATID
ncbi:hypothetical protein JCM14076_30220 [Methylosoma difficile]